jgi:uncharacterized damage-inducible protein DinB
MPMSDELLAEFDHEMATSRTVLSRIPDERFGWKPHPKSLAMGALGSHLANLSTWMTRVLLHDSFDLAPAGGPPPRWEGLKSGRELLAWFDTNVAAARAALAAADDAQLRKPWSLLAGGKALFTLPRAAALRSMVFNHIVHHRGQLTVYLRLCDIPVPQVYGPTADEGSLFGS